MVPADMPHVLRWPVPQFRFLHSRATFLGDVSDEASFSDLDEKVNEFTEFVSNLKMGSAYSKRFTCRRQTAGG